MKIYLSATFKDRLSLRPIRDALWAKGHTVVSSWLDETIRPDHITPLEWGKKLANKDRAEVLSADLFILDANGMSVGKSVELGIALGQFQNILIWLVGPQTHIFHDLADAVFPTWPDAIAEIDRKFKSCKPEDACLSH